MKRRLYIIKYDILHFFNLDSKSRNEIYFFVYIFGNIFKLNSNRKNNFESTTNAV